MKLSKRIIAALGGVAALTVAAGTAPPSWTSIILTPGSAPGSPTNGQLWTTTSGLFARINGGTVGPYAGGTVTSVSNPSIFGVTCSVATATTTPAITCVAGTSLVLGTPASGVLTNLTGLPISTGISGLGTGVATAAAVNLSAAGGLSTTVASGTSALGTSAISSGACATAVTTTATNTATTDVIWWGFNGDPTGVTGYVPTTNGMLTIIAYPSTNNTNFKICNNTSSSVTPGAITLNWRVIR